MQVTAYNIYGSAANTSTLTFILSIWGAVASLLGIVIGSYLARSGQKRQWIAQEKAKEWRALFGTLTHSFSIKVQHAMLAQTSEIKAKDFRAHVAATVVLSNRLFIGKAVRRLRLLQKWVEAVETLDKDHHGLAFGETFGGIRQLIEEASIKDIDKL
jgi:hypothetical protein